MALEKEWHEVRNLLERFMKRTDLSMEELKRVHAYLENMAHKLTEAIYRSNDPDSEEKP
jgi:hypothetical protein